jgi:hypothetical protein
MKRTLSTLLLGFVLITNSFAQSAQDTKDFIREKIDANDPIPSYDNFVFFENILKPDADHLAGKKLTDEEFKHLFIYGRECHINDNRSSGIWLTVAECIDVRGITKVSTTRNTGKDNYYSIKVYLSGEYYAKKYYHGMGEDAKWEYLPHMEILIGDNAEAANKIKKAIIHLGQVYGITIKDGDLF